MNLTRVQHSSSSQDHSHRANIVTVRREMPRRAAETAPVAPWLDTRQSLLRGRLSGMYQTGLRSAERRADRPGMFPTCRHHANAISRISRRGSSLYERVLHSTEPISAKEAPRLTKGTHAVRVFQMTHEQCSGVRHISGHIVL